MPKPIAPTTTIRRTRRRSSLRLPLVGAAVSVVGFGVLMTVYLCKSIFWPFLFSRHPGGFQQPKGWSSRDDELSFCHWRHAVARIEATTERLHEAHRSVDLLRGERGGALLCDEQLLL